MRRGNIQIIHERDDVGRHLLDRVDALFGDGAATASRIVKNQIERFRQRHLRRLPNLAGISGGGHQNQRLSSTMRFVVEIDTSRQSNVRHLYPPRPSRPSNAWSYVSQTAYHRTQTAVET